MDADGGLTAPRRVAALPKPTCRLRCWHRAPVPEKRADDTYHAPVVGRSGVGTLAPEADGAQRSAMGPLEAAGVPRSP